MNTNRHRQWTIHGGPNDGLKIWFKPAGHRTTASFGADKYAVRHHDMILLFRGYDPKTDDAGWMARCHEMVDDYDPNNG